MITMMRGSRREEGDEKRGVEESGAFAHKSKRGEYDTDDLETTRLFKYRGILCAYTLSIV